MTMQIFCPLCGRYSSLTPDDFRCTCGGAWEPVERSDFDPAAIEEPEPTLWRYRAMLAADAGEALIHLGAGWTPLLPVQVAGRAVLCKIDYLAPTASFKDRGTSVMINVLTGQGVSHVADDSSGNAGASVAAYAARAGMRADIFVPAYASPLKQAQIATYGARVHPIPGPREEAKAAALEAARQGMVLASHAYHPAFLLGQQTVAWEIWEQMGRRSPDWFVVPLGQGLHLLAAWLGFRRLLAAGLIERLPRLVGVQARRIAPVYRAFESGLESVPAVELDALTVAEGVAIAQPVRGERVLQALRDTGGLCLAADEAAILTSQQALARQGFFIEPTSATVIAALPLVCEQAGSDDTIVVVLTGSGLKGNPQQ